MFIREKIVKLKSEQQDFTAQSLINNSMLMIQENCSLQAQATSIIENT